MKVITFILFTSAIIFGCNELETKDQTNYSSALAKDEIILVNKKFIEVLRNESIDNSIKIKKAFRCLKVFEPLVFGFIRGDINHKLSYNYNRAGSDVSKYKYNASEHYYSYILKNSTNIFYIENQDYPKEIINHWMSSDTSFFQVRTEERDGFETQSLHSYIDENSNKIYILNGNVEMIDVRGLINVSNSKNRMNQSIYFDILQSIIVKLCKINSETIFKNANPSFWNNEKGFYINPLNHQLVEYVNHSPQIQKSFKTKELAYAQVKLFSRYTDRAALNIKKIEGVFGINQFFMDHDLTSGFVHPFTKNFFDKLPENGYALVFDRSLTKVNQGRIYYKKKSDLSIPTDVLGQNLAFCRQWKLSDLDLKGNLLNMKKSTYNVNKTCPQLKNGRNPFTPAINEVPIWSTYSKEGYVDYRLLNLLTDHDGGTVVIIWTTKKNQILFMDVHGSISEIIDQAKRIKSVYNVDPTIGIYDSGTFARKFKADENGIVDFNLVNQFTGKTEFVGAGYGYLK